MIGRLAGIVIESPDAAVMLDVGGVGYELTVPDGTLGRAAKDHEGRTVLCVHTHVREDALELFGFASSNERAVFRLLLTTPNVGPKLAVSILGALPPRELAEAVHRADAARMRAIPGVGKKTADRLLLELKEKLPKLGSGPPTPASPRPGGDLERLHSALTNMGYRPAEADRAVKALKEQSGQLPLEALLREALRLLA